jgi:phosphoribosylformimino-5-aminoimidazole carboxamide ribotide isomerase
MRLIPVIDLLDGQVVHAVKGDRKRYLPVRSILCDQPDGTRIARSFRDRLGLNEIYIADLNAIRGDRHAGHKDLISSLARSEGFDVLLDAGISAPEDVQEWLSLGIRKAIIGAETLREVSAIQKFHGRIEPDRLAFSLDIRSGRIISQCPELAAMSPIEGLSVLRNSGWPEIILLDLDRVGSEGGVDRSLIVEARTGFPNLNFLVGGGIANPEQLVELKSLGVAGVLVATALHRGIVTAQHISALGDPGNK